MSNQLKIISQNKQANLNQEIAQEKLLIAQMKALKEELQFAIEKRDQTLLQVRKLVSFAGLLNSTLDPDDVKEKALEATCELLSCETASLFLVDRHKSELYWETALGEMGKKLKNSIRLPIDNRSIAGYVAMTGEVLMIHDVQKDSRHFKKATKGGFKTQTMLCMPLLAKGRVIGVIQAINKKDSSTALKVKNLDWPCFSFEDKKIFEALSAQVSIAVENSILYQSLKQSFYHTVEALAEAIEKKDQYTGGHAKRVEYYSLLIGKHFELSESELERLKLGAILHDVGKIGVEDKILKKQAPLDDFEWTVMREHPALGFEILNRVEGLRDVIAGMRFHHERWDGKGYPLGLKGEEIPLIARIIAVADAFDAMISTRPYRKGMPPKVAVEEIKQQIGTQFDPNVVKAFCKAFQNEKMGKGSGGSRHK